jgi:inosose dehydratase
MVRIANAPCSYGAYEETVGVHPGVPEPESFLHAVKDAGYEGTELGPVGYLGEPDEVAARLTHHGLELVGAFVPMRLSDEAGFLDDVAQLERTLDVFRDAGAPDAKVVLADAGSLDRRGRVGAANVDRSIGLSAREWRILAASVADAASLSESRGHEAVFHPHAGTYIEAGWEVDRLLDLTEARLVFDPGHVALAGDDPVRCFGRWRSRIGHIHVKDVNPSVLMSLGREFDMSAAWRQSVFCELGQGSVDLGTLLAELLASDYRGWVVVEQDHIPVPSGISGPAAAQVANREWLAQHFGI